ncbi:alpha/beta hydrolase [Fodinicola acaciae]|uniref:alpha/beta hydrolase n=1 Tax=Fodinicola acaciae TaxID=2681555 RepID=UPI0013D53EF2|nr:alpha/beta hydrolase [Fodinicola acaciae]
MTGLSRHKVVAVLAAAALVLAGCGSRAITGDFSPGPAGSGAPAGAAPVQPVNWQPCPGVIAQLSGGQANPNFTYSCGSVSVPQDWSHPGGGTFQISLVRAKSKNQHNRIGSLLVNPGGPGAAGTQLALYLTQSLPTDVTSRFDLVGFDPRGVGRSAPVKCIPDTLKDKITALTPDPTTPEEFDQQVALSRQVTQLCQNAYPKNLPLYTTDQTARDLDAIRAAVGDKKLTYLGFSYGTELGATYAHLFPTNIRALVLDGAVDPKLDLVQSSEGQAAGFERAFTNFANDCRQHSSCPIGGDPQGSVMSLLRQLKARPLPLPDGRKFTDGLAFTGVLQALYQRSAWSIMAAGVQQALAGQPEQLLLLADQYNGRSQDGTYDNQTDAFITIGCNDDDTKVTLNQIRGYQAQWRARYPLTGGSLASGMISCTVWQPTRDPVDVGAATGAPPIVVVGTINDPATPYKNTASLARLLGTGVVLTWQGEGHTAYPITQCIRDAVDDYLIDLRPPAANTTCPTG